VHTSTSCTQYRSTTLSSSLLSTAVRVEHLLLILLIYPPSLAENLKTFFTARLRAGVLCAVVAGERSEKRQAQANQQTSWHSGQHHLITSTPTRFLCNLARLPAPRSLFARVRHFIRAVGFGSHVAFCFQRQSNFNRFEQIKPTTDSHLLLALATRLLIQRQNHASAVGHNGRCRAIACR
jgi:hypothetical protein